MFIPTMKFNMWQELSSIYECMEFSFAASNATDNKAMTSADVDH